MLKTPEGRYANLPFGKMKICILWRNYNGRIVISDPLPSPLKYVRAIKLDVVAVIITPTDLSNYGFIKIRCFPDMWARWQIIA